MLLTFTINKQLIKRTDCEIPVAKSENYLYAQFSFSDEWVGTKTAIFNNGTAYSVILDEDNKCLVPWEVITESGFSVSVYCGERITANVSFVKVLPSGYIEGQTPADPTPTVYEQIIEELNGKLEPDNLIAGANITITINGKSVIISSSGGGSGTGDYDDLENKPSINSVELSGNKSLSELGIQPSGSYATSSELTAEATVRQNADLALQNGKQDTLVSQTNIKSINGQSILGSGDLTVGGSTSFTPDSTLYLENEILGIDFAEDTQSGLETGKAVRSNEFNTAMNTISTTFGGFVTQLAGKEDAFTVGKGLSLANGVMSAVPRRMLFVSALPTTDIDQEAIYLRKHARYFPQLVDSQGNSLIQKIEGVDQKVAITEDGKFIRFNTTDNTFYSSFNTIKAFEYDIYITDGTSWTYASSSTTGGDTSWATAMGWDITETYSNILYSNCDFRYTGAYKHYDPSTNRAKVDGTAENTSTLPPYIFMMWEYNGSSWEELGICDFTELFNKVETEIASKADSATTYTKTEVDTLISTAIADVSALIGGAS